MGLASPNKTQILLLLPTTLLLILLSLISSAAIAIAAVVVSKDDNPIMEVFMASVTPTPYGWSSATQFCDWRGVECDTKNRVISLTLPSQSLSGTLPSSLNSLSHLTTLSLQNNHFSGPLPSFSNLFRLRKLYLDNNSFTSVPTGAFSGLINLQILSLSNNADLSSWRFPCELSDSPKMVALYASNANIVGSIPDIFRGLARLVNLTLSYNNLTGYLPGSLKGSGIQILKLDNQKSGLSGSIDLLSGMHNLSVIWLNGNKFSGVVPPSLVYLPNLTDVRLDRNNFIGPIPAISHFSKDVNLGTISSRNDYVVGTFSCRRCKVFIRADVGNVGVAAPPTEDSSSGNKTNVGEVVGLSFLLVFVILVFFVCICWNRRSATARERGVHLQQAVVQRGLRTEENPPPPRIMRHRPLLTRPPPRPQNGVMRHREGEQPLPARPPPQNEVMMHREGEPPLPARPPPQSGVMRHREGEPPLPARPPPQNGVMRHREGEPPLPARPPPRNEVMRHREGEPPLPARPPPQNGVMRHREGEPPLPARPPPQNGVMRHREGEPPLPARPPPRNEVMRHREGEPPLPARPPPQNAVMRHREGEPPLPARPPPQNEVMRHREGEPPLPTRPPPQNGVMRHREGEPPLPTRPPPQNGVMRHREGEQPLPARPPPQNGVMRCREETQPQPPLPLVYRDEIIRPKMEKQAQPPAPSRDGVPERRDEKQPRPPPLRDEVVQGRREGKQERQEPPEDEERRRERIREGKRPQQQQQEPRDEEVERENRKGRDGNQTHEVAREYENSLRLPNKYTYEDLKTMTNEFHSKNNIGEGSYGTVYKGTLPDGTTMVAVKCLKFGVGQNDFKNEVEALGRTDHPNLVKLIGYCAENLLRVLVYEYMLNGSLEKWIFHASSRRLLTWPEMKNIIEGIAKGLLHLHDECRDKKILHRDLKPSNVVLDDNMNAKLCDFGFAKLLDKDQNSTSTRYAGTPAYMAPEVKENKRISYKIDVYSFGILVLEVLFEKRYYNLVRPGHNRVEENELPYLMNKNLSEEMRKHSKEIEEIGKLAVWCIREEPENRPRMSTIVDCLRLSQQEI